MKHPLVFLLLPLLVVQHCFGQEQLANDTSCAVQREDCFGQEQQLANDTPRAAGLRDSSSCQQYRPETATTRTNNNTVADGIVHELDYDTFVPVIGSSSFTFVLMYDGHDTSNKVKQKQILLELLAEEHSRMKQPSAFFLRNLRIHFAQLDRRKHQTIRYSLPVAKTYKGVGADYHKFYRNWNDLDKTWSEISTEDMISSNTFMAKDLQDLPTMPSIFFLFDGNNFNVANCIDKYEGIDDTDLAKVKAWIKDQIRHDIHYFTEPVDKPALPFKDSERGPKPAIRSQIQYEEMRKNEYQASNPMNSIDWEAADKMARQQQNISRAGSMFDASLFKTQYDKDGDAWFKYKLSERVTGQKDAEIIESLSYLINRYLAWANSYENLWDEDRRQLENEKTNYGYYLQKMDDQLKDTLFSVFAHVEEQDDDSSSALIDKSDVPNLKRYFEEMIFGYGRSPTSLNNYLQNNFFGKKHYDKNIDLFERIREFMKIRELEGIPGKRDRYGIYFKTLWIKWHAIMSEFIENLSRHYLGYLESHPEEKSKGYLFQSLDIVDMEDPNNFDLLSNYDKFEQNYLSKRKAVVLSNVKMTEPYNYTLEFLVEKCGSMDVTRKVKKSVALGRIVNQKWGGLQKFKLPKELRPNESGKTDISLEQFVALMKRFNDIYLHDYDLKTTCTALFWENTPYDPPEQQYFRLPSVIGSYDLFQRLPRSAYANTWPSLFIGRKGSNSKLHIDASATGFLMYLIEGRKRWVLYDQAERPFLYENIHSNSFMADVLALNSTSNEANQSKIHQYFNTKYPLMRRANIESRAYEIVQEPGQLLYIPPNTPHAVENLDDIIGVSFNIVPRAGIAQHVHEDIHHLHQFASVEIALRYLQETPNSFVPAPSFDPLRITLGEFSAQH